MVKKTERYLLPIDGSASSLGTVRYISNIPSFKNAEIVLFHVLTMLPEHYFDLEYQDQHKPYATRLAEIKVWEMEREKRFEEFFRKAKGQFRRSGFPDKSIQEKLRAKRLGIARDIIQEADQGKYAAVVISRKGAGQLKDIVLGNVTNKMLERILSLPLCLVGQSPKPGKILLAFDGSPGSKNAVDFAGHRMGTSGFEIELIHVIRGEHEKYVSLAKESMEIEFDQMKKQLIGLGFEPDMITSKIVTGAGSRAGTIVKEASLGNYGTIVIGRRGLSRVQEFIMGRVSNKVVQMAKKQAVWVVN